MLTSNKNIYFKLRKIYYYENFILWPISMYFNPINYDKLKQKDSKIFSNILGVIIKILFERMVLI